MVHCAASYTCSGLRPAFVLGSGAQPCSVPLQGFWELLSCLPQQDCLLEHLSPAKGAPVILGRRCHDFLEQPVLLLNNPYN